jgi:hypothetical protein
MINSVSSAPSASTAVLSHTVPQPKPQTPSTAPQDSVKLSSKATAAASGDVDHDGDSA